MCVSTLSSDTKGNESIHFEPELVLALLSPIPVLLCLLALIELLSAMGPLTKTDSICELWSVLSPDNPEIRGPRWTAPLEFLPPDSLPLALPELAAVLSLHQAKNLGHIMKKTELTGNIQIQIVNPMYLPSVEISRRIMKLGIATKITCS